MSRIETSFIQHTLDTGTDISPQRSTSAPIRFRGRDRIQASREAQPNAKRFTVRRILGAGDLWISELVMTYDGQPSYVVSIMEFVEGEVVHETQYFGDPFSPGPSRTQWVESME